MDKGAIQIWAERFAADLQVGDERVPLERVIAAHLDELQSLRARGLTWGSIASIIARSGGRRANNRLISADQLRAGVSRLVKRPPTELVLADRHIASHPARQAPKAATKTTSSKLDRPAPSTERDRVTAIRPPAHSDTTKDPTDADIAVALSLLKLPT